VSPSGALNQTLSIEKGGKFWVGLSGEPFVANVVGYFDFMKSVASGTPNFHIFDLPNNKFEGRDVMSIVIELPNKALGGTSLNIWATITGIEGTKAVQVSRWGKPLAAFLVASTQSEFDAFNAGHPADRAALEKATVQSAVAKIVSKTSALSDAGSYGAEVAQLVAPIVLPYRTGTPAAFSMMSVNGRSLSDNVFDVMMTLTTNHPISSGVATTAGQLTFPYAPKPRGRTDVKPVIERAGP
jgi:Domain of unknown function (DUF4331)